LYRYLNSRETLDFFGNLFHLSKGERNNRAEQLLEMVGLGKTPDARHRRIFQGHAAPYRAGAGAHQRSRPGDSRRADFRPRPIGCREVKDLIVALARRGKTVILSSHLLADVEDVCNRVVIYYGGKIQAAGTLKDLLAEPDTLRITTPVLPRETLERVLEIIRKDVSTGEVHVDNPTQNLESYFLDVVQKARAAAAENERRAIRRAGGGLFAGGRGRPSGGGDILENWRWPQQAAQPAAKIMPVTPVAAPKMDEKKLEAMAKVFRASAGKTRAVAGNEAGGFVEGG